MLKNLMFIWLQGCGHVDDFTAERLTANSRFYSNLILKKNRLSRGTVPKLPVNDIQKSLR